MIINSLAKKVLTGKELDILYMHFEFFKALASESVVPSTPELRHFVQVAQGKALPESEFELIWWRYQALLELGNEYERVKSDNDSLRQQVESWRRASELGDCLQGEQLIQVTMSEAEANKVASKLAAEADLETKAIATMLIKKIKKLQAYNLVPSPRLENFSKCNACGSYSPNLCRCSE